MTYNRQAERISNNQSYSSDLFRMADILHQFADIMPEDTRVHARVISGWYFDITNGPTAKQQLADAIRKLRRELTAGVTKDYADDMFSAEIKVPNTTIRIKLYVNREKVCRKVDTGRTEEVQEIDYSNAPVIMVTKPVIEWQCDPVLDAE